MKSLNSVIVSGREVLPIFEGGKGVAVSNGESAGAFAAAGCVGTVSGVNADSYDDNGNIIQQVYHATTRRERWHELISYAIDGGIAQAKIAHEKSGGEGRVHVNVLWEAAGTQQVIEGILQGAKGFIHGVTCGAGMPYKIAEIVSSYGVYYHPIISSTRAFRALWKRSYHKHAEFLGSVVYEDPWLAGGHNGLSNAEDPEKPQDPYPRIVELRKQMREFGLDNTPIVMAGGVWYLREWQDWLDNPDLGPIAFQFGTRPLLTRESPVPDATLQRYLDCKNPGDIVVSRAMDGLPQRMIMNELLADLEKAGGLKKLIVALRNGLAFRKHTGASVLGLLKSAISMSRDDDMTAAQAIMSANAPMIIQKAMVDGQPSRGVLPSGQVAGVIDELLSCEELINSIVTEAEQRLALLALRVSEA